MRGETTLKETHGRARLRNSIRCRTGNRYASLSHRRTVTPKSMGELCVSKEFIGLFVQARKQVDNSCFGYFMNKAFPSQSLLAQRGEPLGLPHASGDKNKETERADCSRKRLPEATSFFR